MGSTNIASQVNIGDIPGGNYTKIGEDGSVRFLGTSSMWDDMRFPASFQRQGATTKPDFDYDNVGLLYPQNDPTEIAYINVQLPHGYKLGTTLEPHVHFIQSSVLVPIFKIQYKWYDNGDAVPGAFTTVATGVLKFPYVSGSILQVMAFPALAPTGITDLSSMLDIKLYRDDNVVTGDVLVKEFDIHYEVDALGSSTILVK